ncbi:MAG: aromatic ring-hydroxylating dioxygenase subunit alpha [Gammaproteobacteria bacterium]|nr:MAG: aromatic ring-hydroxylating dioxygenase subunit alpha [Gammaproteobacteria bacterium]
MTHTIAIPGTASVSVESVLKPIEVASGLPNEAYTTAEFLELERDQVLGKSWAGLGFLDDLPRKSYAKPIDFMGLPFLVLRNSKDQIKVFHNVCSHRGMRLVNEETEIQGSLRCPYHSWSYNLDGELKATPHLGGVGQHKVEGFHHCDHGLKPVRSHVWMGVIFINLSGDAPEFNEYIEPLAKRWNAFLGNNGLNNIRSPLDDGKGLRIEVRSNWKLPVENYCESYHLPWIHPDLNRYSRLEDHYHIMIGENFGGQGSTAYRLSMEADISLPLFPEWPQDKLEHAEYIAFYPNVLLGLQTDHVYAMIIEPVSHDRSIEHLRLFYVNDEAISDKHADSRKTILETWRAVFGEDVDAVEGLQKGRASPGFSGGVFSPVMDNPTHHFHCWVAQKLQNTN